jgi:hypothetical protein
MPSLPRQRRHTPRHARALLGACLAAACVVTGCSGSSSQRAALATDAPPPVDRVAADPASARTSVVLPSDSILEYERDPYGTFPADRFEFGRRDRLISATERVPLLATQQWPEPARPPERPVQFRRWEQR